jgi:hypothetical protein
VLLLIRTREDREPEAAQIYAAEAPIKRSGRLLHDEELRVSEVGRVADWPPRLLAIELRRYRGQLSSQLGALSFSLRESLGEDST